MHLQTVTFIPPNGEIFKGTDYIPDNIPPISPKRDGRPEPDEPEHKRCAPEPKVDIWFDYAAGDQLLLSALRDFDTMRTMRKRPMTDRARKLLLAELDKLAGRDNRKKIAMLERSILKGWLTVYKPDDAPAEQPKQAQKFL